MKKYSKKPMSKKTMPAKKVAKKAAKKPMMGKKKGYGR